MQRGESCLDEATLLGRRPGSCERLPTPSSLSVSLSVCRPSVRPSGGMQLLGIATVDSVCCTGKSG